VQPIHGMGSSFGEKVAAASARTAVHDVMSVPRPRTTRGCTLDEDLKKNGKYVSRTELYQVRKAVDIMDEKIVTALKEGGAEEEVVEIWQLHKEHLDRVYDNGGTSRNKKAPVHPVLLNWAIAFLARTSASTYNEVRRVMKLPHISYIYRKTAEMVSTMGDKAYFINFDTCRGIGGRADKEKWTAHQRWGAISVDSCNVTPQYEHDYVSNGLVGGDESHRLGGLTHMFQLLAQKVRDANKEVEEELLGEDSEKKKVSLQ